MVCLPQSVPVEGSTSQLFLHLHYKDLQSDLPSKVRCSNPGEHAGWRNTQLNVPMFICDISFQRVCLWIALGSSKPSSPSQLLRHSNIFSWTRILNKADYTHTICTLWICFHNKCWHRKIIFKNHIKWTVQHAILITGAKLQRFVCLNYDCFLYSIFCTRTSLKSW